MVDFQSIFVENQLVSISLASDLAIAPQAQAVAAQSMRPQVANMLESIEAQLEWTKNNNNSNNNNDTQTAPTTTQSPAAAAASAAPAGFHWDPDKMLFHNSQSGYYFDPQSQHYIYGEHRFRWDAETSSYVPVLAHQHTPSLLDLQENAQMGRTVASTNLQPQNPLQSPILTRLLPARKGWIFHQPQHQCLQKTNKSTCRHS
eukprot:GABV01000575.1.p3 GENE.GABV01000575.1~~GABV01000575.1.p3  ORF type:complete len:202 (+),score=65.28 GABV01000575.1:362-967(+)